MRIRRIYFTDQLLSSNKIPDDYKVYSNMNKKEDMNNMNNTGDIHEVHDMEEMNSNHVNMNLENNMGVNEEDGEN